MSLRTRVASLSLAGACVVLLAPAVVRARPADQPVPRGQVLPVQQTESLRQRIEGDNRRHPVASVAAAQEALQVLERSSNPKEEIWFLLALVRDLRMLGDYGKAQAFVERARPLVARHGAPADRFQLEVGAAAILFDRERYADCKALLEPLLSEMEARAAGEPRDVETHRALGSACRFYGAAQASLGAVADAIRVYRRAQALYGEIGDRLGQAWVLDQMAALYQQLGRLQEAEQSALQAVAQAAALRDRSLEASFRLALSNVYGAMKDGARQRDQLERASRLAQQAGDRGLALTITVNTADVCLKAKDYRASLEYSDAGLRLATQANDASAATLCHVNRGIALNRLGSSREGLEEIRNGLEHFKAVQSRPLVAEISAILAEECAFAGDFRQAYEAHVAFKAVSDELMRADDRRHVAEATVAFETDKKQLQIEALQRERRNLRWRRALSIAIGCLGLVIAAVTIVGGRQVRVLKGLIPICSYCKKIRNDQGYWSQVEQHIRRHPKAEFSHGICPDCEKKVMEQLSRDGQI